MDLVARAERLTKEEARLSREREELKESMKQVTEKQKAQAYVYKHQVSPRRY